MSDFPDLTALKAGERAAWDEAFRRLWPMALRAAQHPEARLVAWEAEDVANEAILELISQIDAVASADEMKALVITIAFRRAISLARRKSAAKRRLPDNGEPNHDDPASSPMSDLTDMEKREMVVLLGQALEAVDRDTRLLLKEKIELDLTYHEISARHGIPLGTVCTKVARGLKKIRAQLQQSPALMKELGEYLR
jgi:RNA polymerase sigma-70 factor, ECF subfamily